MNIEKHPTTNDLKIKDFRHHLSFMVSNGLIANPAKTSFLIINQKNKSLPQSEIRIGNDLAKQEKTSKLLSLNFDDELHRKSHIYGTGGLISSLNSRIFMIKRLSNALISKALLKVVDGIFTFKLRYGLQLLGKVKQNNTDCQDAGLQDIQLVQNLCNRMCTVDNFLYMC